MKYTLFNADQQKIVDYGVKVNDVIILNWIRGIFGYSRTKTMRFDDETFFWVKLEALIEDYPALGLELRSLTKRVDNLVLNGFLDKRWIVTKNGKRSYYRATPKLDDLFACAKAMSTNGDMGMSTNGDMGMSTNGDMLLKNPPLNLNPPLIHPIKTTKKPPLPTVVDSEFENFWNDYDKKEDRKKCESKWKKLSSSEKELIKIHVPKYVASTADKQYRKNPLTYLNGMCWNDEIVVRSFGQQLPPKSANHTIDQETADYYKEKLGF